MVGMEDKEFIDELVKMTQSRDHDDIRMVNKIYHTQVMKNYTEALIKEKKNIT